MKRIFVSYSRQDKEITLALVKDLNLLGYEPWVDQELTGGQIWWDQILTTIRACDIFIFVLSTHSLESAACQREYEYAAQLGKAILPVLVSKTVSINLLPTALLEIQYVEYIKSDRESAFRFSRALNTIPDSRPLPDPLPAEPEVPLSYLGSVAQLIRRSTTLSIEQQSSIVLELKRGLKDPAHQTDAFKLLERFRQRKDLYAIILDELNDLETRFKPKARYEPKRTTQRAPKKTKTPRASSRSFFNRKPYTFDGSREYIPAQDRLLTALWLALICMGVGLLQSTAYVKTGGYGGTLSFFGESIIGVSGFRWLILSGGIGAAWAGYWFGWQKPHLAVAILGMVIAYLWLPELIASWDEDLMYLLLICVLFLPFIIAAVTDFIKSLSDNPPLKPSIYKWQAALFMGFNGIYLTIWSCLAQYATVGEIFYNLFISPINYWFFLPLGAAIAGYISGPFWRNVAWVLAVILIMVLIGAFYWLNPHSLLYGLLSFALPIVMAYIAREHIPY